MPIKQYKQLYNLFIMMKNFKVLVFCFTFIAFNQFSYSQENEKIIVGEKIKFKSDVLGHEREIYIYLPSGYEKSSQTYPVVYTTDAEQSFLLMTSMFEIFPKGGILPNAIIINGPDIQAPIVNINGLL